MSADQFRLPDEGRWAEFFGGEAIERAVEDGYWCYEVSSAHGTTMRFSIDLYEESVPTEIRAAASTLVTVSHEMAIQMTIDGSQLRCEFGGTDYRTVLTIDAAQEYRTVWATLRTK